MDELQRGISPNMVASMMSHDRLLGSLPPSEEFLKEGIVEKRSQEKKWQERRIILTSTHIILTTQGSDMIKDSIFLRDVSLARSVSHLDGHRFDLLDRMKEHEEEREIECGQSQNGGSFRGKVKQVAHVDSFTFEVHTREESESCGRVYVFRSFDEKETDDWVKMIDEQAKLSMDSALHDRLGEFERMRYKIAMFYDSNPVQSVVAFLITINFLANAAQSELLPKEGSSMANFFAVLDDLFTILFTIELGLNLISHWFWPFISDGWSVFDFVIVSISLIAMIVGNLPGVKSLRLMRAFRVLRLFGRLQSLRQIITALTHSIVPVLNAFLIMLLVTCIYAILAVNFYSDRSPEFFGSFLAPASPSSSGGDGKDHLGLDGNVALFFVSFIVIVGWTLLQVVVAVLLDNFTAAAEAEKEDKIRQKNLQEGRALVVFAIDPLLAALAHFDTSQDLSDRISMLFNILDTDDSNTLSFEELSYGLRKLKVRPPISLSRDDFEVMTIQGSLLNDRGELGPSEFDKVMRRQLKLYVQRQMANAMDLLGANSTGQQDTLFFVLKLLMIGRLV
ncbi:hypothetical protein GUITHDRAFT_114473 [Guillardia theta CCMP2712]|uniref:EF-hand domain-containing protein n=1 Tax=Guillardia theta (strain CCMP2712) TaxID=905079 RepID=L1ITS0_GUITC|nr:hypothetical protein GUITHDRAFT_114473 [Guillardia theta CCMP2712]EKX39507.1 hypothetical protein GUITHDRAFT_114473 [Guillardia theta CCMP2712]|eukprot:XP_005826487.1 hypothetical protein GUITHDRAFT_114473 [Guillardia theta CCMP2712]